MKVKTTFKAILIEHDRSRQPRDWPSFPGTGCGGGARPPIVPISNEQ